MPREITLVAPRECQAIEGDSEDCGVIRAAGNADNETLELRMPRDTRQLLVIGRHAAIECRARPASSCGAGTGLDGPVL